MKPGENDGQDGWGPGPGFVDAIRGRRIEANQRQQVPPWLLVRAAEQLQALGLIARLRIVEELSAGERTPQDLAVTLALTQQNVSKHLQVLYGTGLVRRRRDGTRVLYDLVDDRILVLLDSLAQQLARRLRELSERAQGAA